MKSESDLRASSYTPCYCEENIYRLLQSLPPAELENAYAIFISSPSRQVPIYHQRLAKSEGWPVVWDYHVLAVVLPELQQQALDFDTTLPFKTPLREYVERAVQPLNPDLSSYPRWFRFVPGDALLRHFASDRRHMLSTHAAAAPEDDPSASMYKMPPPPQPCISNAEGCCNNLDRYLDMLLDRAADCERMTWKKLDSLSSSSPYGVVLSESQLCQLTL